MGSYAEVPIGHHIGDASRISNRCRGGRALCEGGVHGRWKRRGSNFGRSYRRLGTALIVAASGFCPRRGGGVSTSRRNADCARQRAAHWT
jgi:hypothetical protein